MYLGDLHRYGVVGFQQRSGAHRGSAVSMQWVAPQQGPAVQLPLGWVEGPTKKRTQDTAMQPVNSSRGSRTPECTITSGKWLNIIYHHMIGPPSSQKWLEWCHSEPATDQLRLWAIPGSKDCPSDGENWWITGELSSRSRYLGYVQKMAQGLAPQISTNQHLSAFDLLATNQQQFRFCFKGWDNHQGFTSRFFAHSCSCYMQTRTSLKQLKINECVTLIYTGGGLDSLHLWMLEHEEKQPETSSLPSTPETISSRPGNTVKHMWNIGETTDHRPPNKSDILDMLWYVLGSYFLTNFLLHHATPIFFLRLHAWDERHLMYRLITWRRLPTKPSFREDWQLMNGCSKWCMVVDNSSIINNYHNYL